MASNPGNIAFTNRLEVKICALVGGAAGIFGSLLLVLSYVLFKSCRTQWRRIITYLSITDLLQGLYYIWAASSAVRNPDECLFDIVSGTTVATSSFLWTACCSHYIHHVIDLTLDANNSKSGGSVMLSSRWLTMYHALSWGYPVLVGFALTFFYVPSRQGGLLVLEADSFGCFISEDNGGFWWRVACIYGPLVLSWCAAVGFYTASWWQVVRVQKRATAQMHISQQQQARQQEQQKQQQQQLLEEEQQRVGAGSGAITPTRPSTMVRPSTYAGVTQGWGGGRHSPTRGFLPGPGIGAHGRYAGYGNGNAHPHCPDPLDAHSIWPSAENGVRYGSSHYNPYPEEHAASATVHSLPSEMRLRAVRRRMLLIPLCFVFLRVPLVTYRILELTPYQSYLYTYSVATLDRPSVVKTGFSLLGLVWACTLTFCNSVQGLVNCIFFVFDIRSVKYARLASCVPSKSFASIRNFFFCCC